MNFEIENFPNYFIKYKDRNSRFQTKTKSELKVNDLLYPELSKKLLDVVYEVYYNLGPGFIHYIYRRAIWHEMFLRNIGFDFLKQIEANYLNQYLGSKEVRLYIIENKILLVAIAVKEIHELYKQKLKKYLKHFGLNLGLIVNFSSVPLNYCFVTFNKDLGARC